MDSNDLQFIRPPVTILGLPMRPYSAGTELQFEQVRTWMRTRLAKVLDGVEDERRRNLSAYYCLAIWLYIHGGPAREVSAAVWNPDLFFERMTAFLEPFTTQDILAVEDQIHAIMDAAKTARNYRIDNEGIPDPNSSGRGGQPATSAPSQT